MKFKPILLLILHLLFATISISQIYIPDTSSKKIILGPNNIEGDKLAVAPQYIYQLNATKEELSLQIDKERVIINDLKAKGKLRKRDKILVSKSEAIIHQIERESNTIDSLVGLWSSLQSYHASLLEAAHLVQEGKCVEFTTDSGTLNSDELTIAINTSIRGMAYTELIPATYEKAHTLWEKKKADRNCLSSDPKDCYVWCLIEVKESYKIEDCVGRAHKYEVCPDGFEYDKKAETCYRHTKYQEDADFEYVSAIRNMGNKSLTVLDWRVVECD